jgi:lysophospholipase L1-like esterase
MLIQDSIAFHNVVELEPVSGLDGGLRLQRFPADVRDRLGFKHHSRGRFFARRAAGCELRFVAAGPFVRVALSAQETDATVIVYRGDHAHSRHPLPAGVVTSLFLEDPAWFAQVDPAMLRPRRFAPQVWRLLFNQDAQVAYHHLDAFGHGVRPPAPGETPALAWLAYGSSITFGANTLHPANAYVQHAAFRLGVDVLNQGLPGSCLCEPEMADHLAARAGWDFATLELGVNLAELATPEEFEARARHLIGRLHRARPEAPIFVLNIFPNRADHLRDRATLAAVNTPRFNAIVPRLVAELSHRNVRFIDGRDILTDSAGLHTDLLHPSDEGHLAMGQNLAARLARFVTP